MLGLGLEIGRRRAKGMALALTATLVLTAGNADGGVWVGKTAATATYSAGRLVTLTDNAGGMFSYDGGMLRWEKAIGAPGTVYNVTFREVLGAGSVDIIVPLTVTGGMPTSLVEHFKLDNLALLKQDSAGTTAVAADNDPVGKWTGSIAGWVVDQSTSGLRPLYRTGRQNGLPGLSFTGTLYMNGVTAALNQFMPKLDTAKATIVVVSKPTSFSATRAIVSWANGTTNGITPRYTTTGTNGILYTGSTSSADSQVLAANQTHVTATTIEGRGATGAFCSIQQFSDGITKNVQSSGDAYINVSAANVTASLASTQFRVGATAVTTAANIFLGDIYEILIFNRQLTKRELEYLTELMNTKYALTSIIPARTMIQPWDTTQWTLAYRQDFSTDSDSANPTAFQQIFNTVYANRAKPTGLLLSLAAGSGGFTDNATAGGGANSAEIQAYAGTDNRLLMASAASAYTDGVHSIKNSVWRINALTTPGDLLTISGNKPWTTGVGISHGTCDRTYGYIRARVKMPPNLSGNFAALWLMLSQATWKNERDIFEQFAAKGQGLAGPNYHDQNVAPVGTNVSVGTQVFIENMADDWHWIGRSILPGVWDRFYIDDVYICDIPQQGSVRGVTLGAGTVNLPGTISWTSGSKTISGVGTAFSTGTHAGRTLYSGGVNIGTIQTVTNATTATLVANAGSTGATQAYWLDIVNVYASNFSDGRSTSDPLGGSLANFTLTVNSSGVATGYTNVKQGAAFYNYTGTFSCTSGGTAVVGIGTTWNTAQHAGQTLYEIPGGTAIGVIQTVVDATHITLAAGASKTCAAGTRLWIPHTPLWFYDSAFTTGREVSGTVITATDVGLDFFPNAFQNEPSYWILNYAMGYLGGTVFDAPADGAWHFDVDCVEWYDPLIGGHPTMPTPGRLTVGFDSAFDTAVNNAASAIFTAYTNQGDTPTTQTQNAIKAAVRSLMSWQLRPTGDNVGPSDWDQTKLSLWDAHDSLWISSTSKGASKVDWKTPVGNTLTEFGTVGWSKAAGFIFPGTTGNYLTAAVAWDSQTQYNGPSSGGSTQGWDCSISIKITAAPTNGTTAGLCGWDANNFLGASSVDFNHKLQCAAGAGITWLSYSKPLTPATYSFSRGYRSSAYVFRNGEYFHGATINANQITRPTAGVAFKIGTHLTGSAGAAFSASFFGYGRRVLEPETKKLQQIIDLFHASI